ncbi:MAG: type I-E CRISPR-associated protein Cas7/Cse4/CasC [Gammaproteobacteria bacterium]|nr:type I-E CRISPR-associated protein Cas7/Cse4/CasC [Gammaproteobacteria bacterium]
MSRFIQLHLLTSYPPANLNRDDLGRPKTAVMGGAPRLRVSSQSLKRAWRTSDLFQEAMNGHVGTRTKSMGGEIFNRFIEAEVKEKQAFEWAKSIAEPFGKLKVDKDLAKKLKESNASDEERLKLYRENVQIEQLMHFSVEERAAIDDLVAVVIERQEAPTEDELKLLRKDHTAVDIALFGRMLASSPSFNTEAAAQVAHAISVHKVMVEDDFFTAVDDLNSGNEDMGAGHMGETEFAAGLFYLYLCIDYSLLVDNLGGDETLAKNALAALIESAATVAPTGKQNSFASRARASYLLCEAGNQQPRSLSVAFLKPVWGADLLGDSIKALESCYENMDRAYGACADRRVAVNVVQGEGTLAELIACATE